MDLIRLDRLAVPGRLQPLRLALAPGEMLGVIGPNGAGKSTLLNALAGVQPYSGTLDYFGFDARRLGPKQRAQRIGCDGRDRVAKNGRVRLLPIQSCRAGGCVGGREADVAEHRAAFLRQAGQIERAGRQALQMRGHRDQSADGDDAGAADARHQQPIGLRGRGDRRFGQVGDASPPCRAVRIDSIARPPARLAANYRNEAGAEAFGTGIILVATGLIDDAFAAVGRFERCDR